MISGAGHSAHTAASAEEGLELAAKHKPDVILLDVRLPGKDGITLSPARDGFTVEPSAEGGASVFLVLPPTGEAVERTLTVGR